MWDLATTRTRLGERLAEASTVFWGDTERDDAINDAQRFIAAVTRGVPTTLTGTVSQATPYLTSPAKLLGDYISAGRVDSGGALSFTPLEVVDRAYPGWRSAVGSPRWVIVAPQEDRVYLAPTTVAGDAVTVFVSILPPDLALDSDPLFAGEPVMEKYQSALLNMAAFYLLLKERYDQDAERFYQFAFQELQNLGVSPAEIPPMPRQVTPSG